MHNLELLLIAGLFSLSACAAPVATPAGTARPSQVVTPDNIQPTVSAGSEGELRSALADVGREFGAVQSGGNAGDMARHAQAALNILVGPFGRWYSGDGTEGQGILPGERVPAPAPDVGTPVFPTGWLLRVYNGGDVGNRRVASMLAGNAEVWSTMPRKGYDEIEAALSAGAPPLFAVPKLAGSVPRMVGYARLITLARSMDDARPLAARSVADAQDAVSLAAALSH